MADPDLLTNAFLASHPAEAARVLERLPGEDAAALFERAPARLVAPAFGAMFPYTAARCLLRVDTARAAMLLGGISVPAAAAVLRYVPAARRAPLIDALPTATALACRTLLGFPEDSIGATADTEIVALPPDGTAQEALDALRAPRVVPSGPVYVVDARRRPLGQIALPRLLRASMQDRLDSLMSAVPATLPAVTPLAGAAEHPAWRKTDTVPVVERDGGLIGVAYRHSLRRAQRRRGTAERPAPEALTGVLALGYWSAVAGLVEVVVAAMAGPPDRR
jgi:magnesium transporter